MEISKIGSADNGYKNLHIYDCRPWNSAVGNKIAGRGFESNSNYVNVEEVYFCNIPNIFVVAKSFEQIVQLSQEFDTFVFLLRFH